jgi:hypothetical protein
VLEEGGNFATGKLDRHEDHIKQRDQMQRRILDTRPIRCRSDRNYTSSAQQAVVIQRTTAIYSAAMKRFATLSALITVIPSFALAWGGDGPHQAHRPKCRRRSSKVFFAYTIAGW